MPYMVSDEQTSLSEKGDEPTGVVGVAQTSDRPKVGFLDRCVRAQPRRDHGQCPLMGAGDPWAPLLTGGELGELPAKCFSPVAERGQLALVQNLPVPRWCGEQSELTGSSDRGRGQGLSVVLGAFDGDWAPDTVLSGDESIPAPARTQPGPIHPQWAPDVKVCFPM
ncbi:hypothetical protein [Streptomyces sp. H34-S4]|uniref:hypothetical protein n=1 Tax=Streptomyces sp. H34-S4 TaxID=2996463 RepID=UPI0022702CC7|nr:hypothetical protein [Streptomyces sp. H34-S4]MCY0939525.1 hypothetical protein [Streptomyces sp. H34-S4]